MEMRTPSRGLGWRGGMREGVAMRRVWGAGLERLRCSTGSSLMRIIVSVRGE